MHDIHTELFKAGYVTVVGLPNVGKSTLINGILKFRLSVTTHKPQTTRHRIIGIRNGPGFQVVFLDTPGFIDPGYRLQEIMMQAARSAVEEADLILWVVTYQGNEKIRNLEVLQQLVGFGRPVVLAINKIDLVVKQSLLPLIDFYKKQHDFTEIVPISALKGENVDTLERIIVENLPVGSPFYSPEDVTEHPERFFVSEIIREKVFQNYGEEIPYSTAVVIDEFREREGQKDFIRARIIVERDSQKGIIIGKKGAALSKLGRMARADIEQLLGRPVYLELWVAVRAKWRKKDTHLREFGYHA